MFTSKLYSALFGRYNLSVEDFLPAPKRLQEATPRKVSKQRADAHLPRGFSGAKLARRAYNQTVGRAALR